MGNAKVGGGKSSTSITKGNASATQSSSGFSAPKGQQQVQQKNFPPPNLPNPHTNVQLTSSKAGTFGKSSLKLQQQQQQQSSVNSSGPNAKGPNAPVTAAKTPVNAYSSLQNENVWKPSAPGPVPVKSSGRSFDGGSPVKASSKAGKGQRENDTGKVENVGWAAGIGE